MTDQALPWIVLVSVARSGTTHFIRLIDGIRHIHAVKEEFLNETQVTWAQPAQLERFSAEMGVTITTHLDPRLTAWVRANMARSLELLQADAQPNDRAAMIKLFQRYVSEQEFQDLFLSDPRTMFLILKRRPIDSYISLCKAQALDKWVNEDTTGMRVELDAAAFQEWHADRSTWFHWVETTLQGAGRPYGSLDYDADIAPGSHHMLNRTVEELGKAGFKTRRRFGYLTKLALREMGPEWLGGYHDPRFGAHKQDRAPTSADKVSNWSEFLTQVETQPGGLERLERFTPPLT